MERVRADNWRFASERDIISEDVYSLLKLYRNVQSVAILPEPLYYYCQNNASLTHTIRKDRYPKIVHFYRECVKVAEEYPNKNEIIARLSGPFFSFSIAAMKQIAAANMTNEEKMMLLHKIVDDDTMQELSKKTDFKVQSKARRVLFSLIRMRMVGLLYCVLGLRNLISK
jgi:hypothetical protein